MRAGGLFNQPQYLHLKEQLNRSMQHLEAMQVGGVRGGGLPGRAGILVTAACLSMHTCSSSSSCACPRSAKQTNKPTG
jgi:hypothetical protein